MRTAFTTLLLGLALALAGHAQIQRLSLRKMLEAADQAVVGEIVKREVVRVQEQGSDSQLYFTQLTVSGTSLFDGAELTYVVTFHGGFLNDSEGVWNSEAPSEDDLRMGSTVLVFGKTTPDLGGGLAGHALYAAHGGLFRTLKTRQGELLVQGRGGGYCISRNERLTGLTARMTQLRVDIEAERAASRDR